MKLLERITLIYRANKYKTRDDVGGIAYLLTTVKSGQTVLDIGAHKAGYLYLLLKKVGASGKVYAFEPQSNLFNYIKKLKRLFHWENVFIEHLALTDNIGNVILYIPANKKSNNSSPGASLIKREGHIEQGFTEEVSGDTLDNYCEKHQIIPSFLKIDVEGNELRVFRGGINTLKTYKPKILVEIESRHIGKEKVLATFQYLEELGYSGSFVFKANRLPLAAFEFDKHQNAEKASTYCNNFIFE